MKQLVLIWRDPALSVREEVFDASKFKVRTDPGWLKLTNDEGVLRLIPSDKVCLVQYIDAPEEPRILRPDVLTSNKFQPS